MYSKVLEEAYFHKRTRTRDIMDESANELFIVSDLQVDKFSKQSTAYMNTLSEAVKSKQSTNQAQDSPVIPPSELEMYLHHRKIMNQWSVQDLLPDGYTLSEYLQIDQNLTPSWLQPEMGQIFHVKETKVAHVDLLAFDSDMFDQFVSLFERNHKAYQDVRFSATPVPFSVQYIELPATMYTDIVGIRKRGKVNGVCVKFSSSNKKKISVPARLVIGNVQTGLIDIKFPWYSPASSEKQSTSEELCFKFVKIPQQVQEFLLGLPTLYAVDAHNQATDLQKFLSDLFEFDLNLKVFDLADLALVAGARMDVTNLFSLSILTRGIPFPPYLDNLDQNWKKPDGQLPIAVRYYLINKFDILQKAYEGLFGSLIRNLFPDPDLVLDVTEMTQKSFTTWFVELVSTAISNPVHCGEPCMSRTRSDMISAINPEDPLLDCVAKLIQDIPTVIHGGERYLHHGRYCFWRQYKILKEIRLPSFHGQLPNQGKDWDVVRRTVNFGRYYPNDDSGMGTQKTGLTSSPQFTGSEYCMELSKEFLLKPTHQHGRPIVPAIQEWGRLNFQAIPRMFKILQTMTLEEYSQFWIMNVSLYDSLRSIYFRMTGTKLGVNDLDYLLFKRNSNANKHHINLEAKLIERQGGASTDPQLEVMVDDQRRRVGLLRHQVTAERGERSGAHQRALDIVPGSNNACNRKWDAKRKARKVRRLAKKPGVITETERKRQKAIKVIKRRSDATSFKRAVRAYPTADLKALIKEYPD